MANDSTDRHGDRKSGPSDAGKTGGDNAQTDKRQDEAEPGTPGTGENIDPKTGERNIEGIGGG